LCNIREKKHEQEKGRLEENSHMTDDIEALEKHVDELCNDRLGRWIHMNYVVMLEQAKAQRKSKRWFVCDEDLR
jgi:hypothetical protein